MESQRPGHDWATFTFFHTFFVILHEGSFWNDLFLPFETLDKELKSYLDTTAFLLSLLCNKLMRYLSTQQMESDNKHEFEGFPVFQMVNNLPAMWETRVSSLGFRRSLGKDNDYPLQYSFLGKGNDYPLQYSFLENPWTEKPGRLQSMGSQRVGNDWVTNTFTFTLKRDKNRPKTWSILGGAAGDMEVRGQQR